MLVIILQLKGVEGAPPELDIFKQWLAVVPILFRFYLLRIFFFLNRWLILDPSGLLFVGCLTQQLHILYNFFHPIRVSLLLLNVIHPEKGNFSLELHTGHLVLGKDNRLCELTVLDYFIEQTDLQLLKAFQLLTDQFVDLSEAPSQDRVKLVLDTVLGSMSKLCYLPSMALEISAQ